MKEIQCVCVEPKATQCCLEKTQMSGQRHQEGGQSKQVNSRHQARLPEEEEKASHTALGNL